MYIYKQSGRTNEQKTALRRNEEHIFDLQWKWHIRDCQNDPAIMAKYTKHANTWSWESAFALEEEGPKFATKGLEFCEELGIPTVQKTVDLPDITYNVYGEIVKEGA